MNLKCLFKGMADIGHLSLDETFTSLSIDISILPNTGDDNVLNSPSWEISELLLELLIMPDYICVDLSEAWLIFN